MLSSLFGNAGKKLLGITGTIHSFHRPGFGKGMTFANCRFGFCFYSQGVFPLCVTQNMARRRSASGLVLFCLYIGVEIRGEPRMAGSCASM